MLTKMPGPRPDTLLVTFSIPAGVWAERITLVGDHNNWSPNAHPLERSLHSGWRITLELERGRAYQYRYLLDGRDWCNDCNADDYAPNPFGGHNSVVKT
ncbi:MAG: isoamylase early set domain-containing protein [Chloroflexota bacterium]